MCETYALTFIAHQHSPKANFMELQCHKTLCACSAAILKHAAWSVALWSYALCGCSAGFLNHAVGSVAVWNDF